MTTVNLSCIICQEDYGSSDEVISTYCGHIFHRSCFQDWHSRNPTCPQCRLGNVQTHRVFLQMEPPAVRRIVPEKQMELEIKISQLEHDLAESEANFLSLQATDCGKEKEIQELKSEVEYQRVQNTSLEEEFSKLKLQLQESEKNFLDLIEQTNKNDAVLKDKDIEINLLKLQIGRHVEKFGELKTEHDATKVELSNSEQKQLTLKDKLTVSETQIIKLNGDMDLLKINHGDKENVHIDQESFVLELSLKEKLRVLQEKHRQMSVELDKEIQRNTALTVANMKLRAQLDSTSLKNPDHRIDQNIAVKCKPILDEYHSM